MTTAAMYRQHAELLRAVADATDHDAPPEIHASVALITRALRTAAADLDGLAATADAATPRLPAPPALRKGRAA